MGKTCDNCIDLTNIGCGPSISDNVTYSGPNLPCSNINTKDNLTLALQKIDSLLCNVPGAQGLQQTLINGNTSTDLPIVFITGANPDEKTIIGYNGITTEDSSQTITYSAEGILFGLNNTLLKAASSGSGPVNLLIPTKSIPGTYTIATTDQIPLDSGLLHTNSTPETKSGPLTVGSIIKSGGSFSEYLMADGSTSTLSTVLAAILTPNILDGDTTHAPTGNAVYDAIILKEDVANKITAITGNSAVKYTSEKAVVDYLPTLLTSSIADGDTTHAPTSDAVFDALALKANDNAVVHIAGPESITGSKTFTLPVIGVTPVLGNHLVTKSYADGLVVGLLDDRGSYDASSNLFPTTGGSGPGGTVVKGDIWFVSVAGTLGGKAVSIGDSFRALVDLPGQVASNWGLLSSNLGYVPANDANVIHKTLDEIKTGTLTVNAIIKAGGLATEFLKADGSVDSNVYAIDSNTLHNLGDETFTGIKSSTNTGPTQINGLSLTNNGTGVSQVLNIINGSSGIGARITNNGSSTGVYVNNTSTGTGLAANNTTTGFGITGVNNSSGVLVNLNSVTASIGDLLRLQKNNITTSKFDQNGVLSTPPPIITTVPSTSVGTYDILTRNTSTGQVEKILSSSVVPSSRSLNINGVIQDLTANREWRTDQASSGILNYAGISIASGTQVNVGAAIGYIVDNETNPLIPVFTAVSYPGAVNITVPTLGTGLATYVLLNSSGTLVFQNSFPSSAQRKSMIFLSKIGHPAGVITTAGDEPDFITSPLSQFRDLFQAFNYINQGVYPSANGVNLNMSISAGAIIGDGINFVLDKTNPNTLTVPSVATATFLRRTQTGNGGAATTFIDPTNYDVGGTITAIGGGTGRSTIQYVYYVPGLGAVVQYGQTVYNTLIEAVAAVGRENIIIYPSLIKNAILIGLIALRRDATDLSDTSQAQFFRADIFGQAGGSNGGVSTATLQSAYNNSAVPQIAVTDALGAFTIKNSKALDTSTVQEWRNIAGTTVMSITGNGLLQATNTGATQISGLSLTNTGSGSTQVLNIVNSGTGRGVFISNSSATGAGIVLANSNAALGYYVNNQGTGGGFAADNQSTGLLLVLNSATGSTGDLLRFQKNSVTTLRVDSEGMLRGTNSGATSTVGIDLVNAGTTGTNSMQINNTSTGRGLAVINGSTGIGALISNTAGGSGLYLNNTSTGQGLNINNTSTGTLVLLESQTASTGDLLRFSKNAVTTTKFDQNGLMSATNSGTTQTTGISLTNSGTSGSQVLFTSSTGGGRGAVFQSSGTSIAAAIENTGIGSGFYISNISTGRGATFDNVSTGALTILNSQTASTGDLLRFTKNGSTTSYFDQNGMFKGTNSGSTSTIGIDLTNTGTTGTKAITVSSTNTGRGIEVSNTAGGAGQVISNGGSGTGMYVLNSVGGTGINGDNSSTGTWLSINSQTGSTGDLFRLNKNSTNTLRVDHNGFVYLPPKSTVIGYTNVPLYGLVFGARGGGLVPMIATKTESITNTGMFQLAIQNTDIARTGEADMIFRTGFDAGSDSIGSLTTSGTAFAFQNSNTNLLYISRQGAVGISNTPVTSAGTYDILTRNTSTGLIEKIASTAVVSGSGASGQVSFWSGSNTQSGDQNFFWNNTNKRLGIGTNTPQTSLDIRGEGVDMLSLNQYSNTLSFGGNYSGRRYGGTKASPTATLANSVLTGLYGGGYDGTADSSLVGAIRILASNDFTNTSQGTSIDFSTTPVGSITRDVRMRINSDGTLTLVVTPTTSAGSFDILTRNSSSGVIEKVSNNGFLHASTNESFTGIKSSINTGTSLVNGLSLTNNGTTVNGHSLKITNTSTGVGQYIDNQSTGNALYINNSSGGSAVNIQNASSGRSLYSLTSNSLGIGLESEVSAAGIAFNAINQSTGIGYQAMNNSTGRGFYSSSSSASGGNNFVANVATGSIATNFLGQNNGVTTFSVDRFGNIVGNTYSGGANLSGTPTAPTASAGTNTTQIATTAFVTNAVTNNTYTPTFSNVSNTSTPTITSARYTKIGNLVTVHLYVNIVPTAASVVNFDFTLPITPISNSMYGSGAASYSTTNVIPLNVIASTSSAKAILVPTNTNTWNCNLVLTYLI